MDDEAATQPPEIRPRRSLRIGLLATVLLLGGPALLWSLRLEIASVAIERASAAAGLDTLNFTLKELDLESAAAEDIAVGGDSGQRIARLEAKYSLAGLMRGDVDTVVVSGLHIRGRLEEGALAFEGLPAASQDDSDEPPTIPVRTLQFENSKLELETPQGDVEVTADGKIQSPDGRTVDLEARFTADGSQGRVRGEATVSRLESGEIYGTVALKEGRFAVAPAEGAELSGTIQLLHLSDQATEFDANVALTELTLAGHALGKSRLSFGGRKLETGGFALEATLRTPDGTADLAGKLRQKADSGLAAQGRVAVELDRDDLTVLTDAGLSVELSSEGKLTGALNIDESDIALSGNRISGLSGTARFSRDADGTMLGAAQLSFQAFQALGLKGEPGSVSATLDAETVSLDTALSWAGGALALKASGPHAGPFGFTLNGELAALPPLIRQHIGIAMTGRLDYAASGKLDPPQDVSALTDLAPAAVLSHLDASGWVDMDITRLDVPDLLRDGTIRGRLEAAANRDGIALSTKRLDARVGAVGSKIAAAIPPAIRDHISGPVQIAIRPGQAASATLRIQPSDTGFNAATDLTGRLESHNARLSLTGRADTDLTHDGALRSVASPNAAVRVTLRDSALGNLESRLTVTDLRYTEESLKTRYALKAAIDGRIKDAIDTVQADLSATGQLFLDGTVLRASFGQKGRLQIAEAAIADQFRLTAPATIAQTEPARLRIDLKQGLPSLSYSAALALPDLALQTKTGEDRLTVSLSNIPATLSGTPGKQTVNLNIGALRVPDHDLSMSGIALDLTQQEGLQVAVTADSIALEGDPAYIIPLKFEGSLADTSARAAFKGRLFDPAERISIDLSGQHDHGTKSGTLSADAQKIVFLPTVLQPVELFPILGRTLREVDGEIDILASLAWDADGLTDSEMELLVDTRLIRADEFKFENTAAVIRFDSLAPLSTQPGQEVSIGLLDVGVPMLNGRLVFQLNKDGSVRAALRELDFFGDRIETTDFTIPADYDDFTVPLEVNGVDLDDILALAQSGDLTATGTLNGQIPVAIKGGDVAIRNGVLESAPGGGSIRYRPTAVGPSLSEANEGIKLFLQIVDDFQYDKVRVTLDEDAEGEVAFRFKIEGRNKAVYKGIPVELNVSMDGPLRKLLTQGLKTYKLPERLLTEMKRFEDRP